MLWSAHAVATNYPRIQRCRCVKCNLQWGHEGLALGPMEPAEKSPSSSNASGEMGDGTGAFSFGQRRGSKTAGASVSRSNTSEPTSAASSADAASWVHGGWLLLFLPFHCMDDVLLHGKDTACDTTNRTECPKSCKARNAAKRAKGTYKC